MRQMLLFSLFALLLGAVGIWLVQQDRGYILISLGITTVEMSFWVGVLIYLISVIILMWLISTLRWLLHAGGIRSWWGNLRRSKQMNKTATGLLLFHGGDWQKSSKLLVQSAKNSEIPQVNLVYAATAAGKNKDWGQCQLLLERLKLDYPETAVQADLIWVDFLLQDSKFDQALERLISLNSACPNNPAVLKSMASVYRQQSDWSALIDLLPVVKKLQVFEKKDLRILEEETFCGLLRAFSNNPISDGSKTQLEALWSKIPKQQRQQTDTLIAYIDALVLLDDSSLALNLLSKRLDVQWQDKLIEKFGSLTVKASKKQLAIAEKWLSRHPKNPHLLLALGRICSHMELFGKARDYLEQAVELAPSAQTYFDLATIYGEIGEEKARFQTYQRGLEFIISDH